MESSCSICGIKKPKPQFSKSQWGKKDSRKCISCLGKCGVGVAAPDSPPHRSGVEQNTGGRSAHSNPPVPAIAVRGHAQLVSGVMMQTHLVSILNDLQEENHRLKNELGMHQTREKQYLEDISKYAAMVPQLHLEIERLRKENEDLRSQIEQLRKESEGFRVKIQHLECLVSSLWSAKVRERALAMRRLIDHCRKDEIKDKLSDGAKCILESKKLNKINNIAAHLLSKDLIKDAIENVDNVTKRGYYMEMYRAVFGAFEGEDTEFDDFEMYPSS